MNTAQPRGENHTWDVMSKKKTEMPKKQILDKNVFLSKIILNRCIKTDKAANNVPFG